LSIEQVPIPGVVSFFEEHDCRIIAGYTLTEWYNLNGMERALEVALYRIKQSLDYQKSLKQERDAQLNQRK
jgi:hypothetical protein